MTASLKGKLIAGFILAFLAGGVTGTFVTFYQGHHWREGFAHHHLHSFSERMRSRIQTDLDLTPEQMKKIQPILDQTARELQQIRVETGARVREVINRTNQALQPFLTERQQARLRKMEKRSHDEAGIRQRFHRRASPRAPGDAGTPDE
jgi:Spy/CpxP family protein refolding chaperone